MVLCSSSECNDACARFNLVCACDTSLGAAAPLAAKGAAAPSEVAQAQTRLDLAKASLHSLEEQKTKPFAPVDLSRARSSVTEAQAAVDAAAQVIAQSNVRAPFPGTVYSLPVTRYSYIEPGAEILELADLSKLQVRAYFDEPEIGDLQLNNPVTIVWDAKFSLVVIFYNKSLLTGMP